MKATQAHPQQPTDWAMRCNLARSILNQREPSWHTARVAIAALKGASVDDIMVMDQGAQLRDGAA